MKKIFTLIAATVLTVATFAADRRPVVSLSASRNYEVVIDGRSYFTSNGQMDLSNIRTGHHNIQVFEMNRGMRGSLFGIGSFMIKKPKRLIDASYFDLTNRDINIIVDARGQINIREDRFDDRGRWNDSRDNGYGRDNSYGRDNDHGRDFDHSHDRDWNRNF